MPPAARRADTAAQPTVDLPGRPAPIQAEIRPIPVLNPLAVAVAGLIYAIALAVLVSLWLGLGLVLPLPSPQISLHTGLVLWLAGIGLAVGRDGARKARMSVTVSPGWITRSFGARAVTVPRAEVERVRIRTTLADRLAGTRTVDVYGADGHRLRIPRVPAAGAVEGELVVYTESATRGRPT
ncbi:PH domain-containing protein [Halorientalis sp.]|uniref:PH domain-containing protein n=1 Tax=Halorientalis sp. TaxID=1931229 RepID=UPI002603BE51|nr:PH domain-containing protein [Halorientalis sp.]